jgi:hypothetical protein
VSLSESTNSFHEKESASRVAAERLSQYTVRSMSPIWWFFVFIVISACVLWIVVYSNWNFRDNPVASRIAVGYFLLLSAGPY